MKAQIDPNARPRANSTMRDDGAEDVPNTARRKTEWSFEAADTSSERARVHPVDQRRRPRDLSTDPAMRDANLGAFWCRIFEHARGIAHISENVRQPRAARVTKPQTQTVARASHSRLLEVFFP